MKCLNIGHDRTRQVTAIIGKVSTDFYGVLSSSRLDVAGVEDEIFQGAPERKNEGGYISGPQTIQGRRPIS